LIHFINFALAQVNLVPNSSFEDTLNISSFPPNYSTAQLCTKYWHHLDSLRPFNCQAGYFHARMTNGAFVPGTLQSSTAYGYQLPRHGYGHASVLHTLIPIFNPPPVTIRGVLSCRLRTPLIANKRYCAKAYLSPFNGEDQYANGFGLYFDNGMLDTIVAQDSSGIYPFVQAQVMCDSIVVDTVNWVPVTGTFTAIGNETHIHLANWLSDSATLRWRPPWTNPSYPPCCGEWWIDDVSLIATDISDWLHDTFCAVGDSVYIGLPTYEVPDAVWYTYNMQIIDTASGIWIKPSAAETKYIQAIDVCEAVRYDTITVFTYPTSFHNNTQTRLTTWPNPVNTSLYLKAHDPSIAYVYTSHGTVVAHVEVSNVAKTVDCSNWPNGVYLIRCGQELQRVLVMHY
jgi:hypothetical protein